MPSTERDLPKEGDRHLRHQHSASSDQGRSLVPMWDSSDPERAPPPLPLHPQSPTVSSRAGTSSAIQSAHAALTERARESGVVSGALNKRTSEISPERSLIRGTHHRRMQSLQPGSVRDLSLLLEGGQSNPSSPTKSPEKTPRPSTPSRARESQLDSQSVEKESQVGRATPTPGPSLTPIIRPTVRRPHQSILGENTPPQSATMLALQNMPAPAAREVESPLANVTNGSTALVKVQQPFDSLSNQILSLTNIATALQKDMAQLSRRSRDNATDLLTLKQATNARDEDIRKSLRELISNAHEAAARATSRDPFGGGLFLDNKPYGSSPVSKAVRPFSLPRIPSPNSFAASIDRDSASTPSLFGQDAPGTVTILERILKDMGTKEGQDLILDRLSEVAEKMAGMASAGKVEELVRLVKEGSEQAIVAAPGHGNRGTRPRNFSFDEPPRNLEIGFENRSQAGPMTQRVERLLQDRDSRRSSAPPSQAAAELINDDVLKVIRTVKDSVAQGGGLTAEVKALVRELRGEVLGMGRDIGRKLDEVVEKNSQGDTAASKDEMARVIDEGLDQMKDHMDEVLREHRRQSIASAESRLNTVDYQEIYNAMRAALRDSQASKGQVDNLSREDIIEAVRDAWENYKPEMDNQSIGLGREEVLEYIKEGLHDYSNNANHPVGATRDEVFKAVVEGMKHFVPPHMDSAASLSRDEILDAVRECLEEFEFPVAPSAINAELTRDDMVHAVKEGLNEFNFNTAGPLIPRQTDNDEVVERIRELVDFLRAEFKAVSDEAKQNVAANGRDTEQLLDATKDGLENLRADIEGYISRMHGPTGQEELLESFAGTLDAFREEVAAMVANSSVESRSTIEAHLESLRETVNSSIVPVTPSLNQNEILDALKSGIDSVKAEIHRPLAGTTEVLDALHEGLADLRASMDKVGNRPMDLTANDEILDALKAGLDGVRSDIDALREQSRSDKTIATLSDGAVVTADMLKHDDIKNLEVLITQLRIKVEAMEPGTESVSKDDLSRMEDMLRNVQESVEGIHPSSNNSSAGTDNASREDVQAIETILRNTKARLDDLIDGEQAVRKEHVDAIEALVLEAKEAISTATSQIDGLSRKEDIATVESLVTQVAAGFEEMKERAFKELEDPERVTKSDLDAVEAVCLDIKTVFDQMVKTDLATLTTKEDMQKVDTLLEDLKDRIDAQGEMNSKAFEDRQAETVGVGERVSEVKTFLEEFQELVKGKLEDGATSIDTLGKFLETISETIGQNATLSQDLKEMSDVMRSEFEESKAGVVGVKLEADEKFQQTTDILGAKIDERIAELMAKYDEFQIAMEDRAKAGESHDAETEAAVLGTKAVAEELKTLIDTLGSAVTDSMEKIEEASKTVFNRVEDLVARSDDNHSDNKAEHVQTRQQVKLAVEGVEGLQGQVGEYQPKILEAVKDVLLIVGQHYEYSKTSTTDIQDKIEEAKPPTIEQPLLPPIEKYDDTSVHEKLDKLVDHTHVAGKAFSQLDSLEKVHQQVLQTAAEISTFLAGQTKKITDDEEDKEKALHETTIALERQLVLKDQVEASVQGLHDEESKLREVVQNLRADQERLTRQKTKLTGDVSSLETALRLRREELHDMEARAEGLERRILEGVMDHSRVLLMSKSTKGRDAMNRKRVQIREPSTNTVTSERPVRPTVNLALSAKRNLVTPNPAGASRRILSLSQITGNVQTGGFQRSQSVRNPAGRAVRKGSWAGSLAKGYGDLDKENASLREGDEDDENHNQIERFNERTGRVADSVTDGDVSDTETLRRSSRGTTVITASTEDYTGTEGSYSDDDEDNRSEWTESIADSAVSREEEGNEVVLFEG